MTEPPIKPARCRHGNIWVYAPDGTGSGQIHWCYRCGAIRQTVGDRAYRWTRPVGPIGENPATKEATP